MTSHGSASSPLGARLLELFHRLHHRYGPQHWWPGEGPFETIVGAILTQNTAWPNVERAIQNLKAAGAMSPARLRDLPAERLASLIRPAGFLNAKAKKLKAFAAHLGQRHNDDLHAFLCQDITSLRSELLSIYGIGQETADAILLYAAGLPSFVIDAYTRRILSRLRMAPDTDRYQDYQHMFHANLRPDAALFNEFHALLDRHAKDICRPSPRCESCCLLDLCPTGLSANDAQSRHPDSV